MLLLLCSLVGARADEPRFPSVTLENLLDQERRVPDELAHPYTVVLLAFFRRQQPDADSWLVSLQSWSRQRADLGFIEIPVISGAWKLVPDVVKAELKSAIVDPADRGRTYLYFGEPDLFLAPLGVDDTDQIVVLLAARDGSVRWLARGPARPQTLADLRAEIARVL